MNHAPNEPLTVWKAFYRYGGQIVFEFALVTAVALLAIWFAGA